METIIIIACTAVLLACFDIGIIILRSPFLYPYFHYDFDVSGKRGPQIEDWLDRFLISGGFDAIQRHQERIENWKKNSREQVEHSWLKKYRQQQLENVIDDEGAFQFSFIRSQTRYKQRNYVRSSYKVDIRTNTFAFSYRYIQQRYKKLKDIGFECTLSEYHSKNQRKLATRKLREKIMERDNYTCQICGKYMPDEVGLHVDHVIPVSKGGKSVPSNLRVLCSKCNGSKHDKLIS